MRLDRRVLTEENACNNSNIAMATMVLVVFFSVQFNFPPFAPNFQKFDHFISAIQQKSRIRKTAQFVPILLFKLQNRTNHQQSAVRYVKNHLSFKN